MKIIEYNNATDIVVEFQDEYNAKVHTAYSAFKKCAVKNPYYPSVFEVGMIGSKYLATINKDSTKEYKTWIQMLRRCFSEKEKNRKPTYKDISCCNEWLLYENFYEWLHSQPNFDKWYNGNRWAIDKDILIKGNKIYSPNTCCLVPHNVNALFLKHDAARGGLPLGLTKHGKNIQVWCNNPFNGKCEPLGTYSTIEEAFKVYKLHKEDIIRQVAEIEYMNNNITKQCYNAMLNYKVEITD